jgi:hypothetical protein
MTMNIYVGIRLPRKTEFAAAVMELAMFNWPEMLRHAEDWADGFWA